MNRISFISIFKSPCLQRANLRSIATLCSLLLDVAEGFCRITEGSTINAFNATEFRSELELNCFSQILGSSMKCLPALPDGRLIIIIIIIIIIIMIIIIINHNKKVQRLRG